jgi:hypothetical protein
LKVLQNKVFFVKLIKMIKFLGHGAFPPTTSQTRTL